VTEESRAAKEVEVIETSVESDGFIDAVLEVAESNVAVRRRRMELEHRNAKRDGNAKRDRTVSPSSDVAIDMIDGEALAQPTTDQGELVVDLTDNADPAPVAKAKSRSAATAKAKTKPQPKPRAQTEAKAVTVPATQPSAPKPAKPAKSAPAPSPSPAADRIEAAASLQAAVADSSPTPNRAVTPVVDFRSVAAAPVAVKRRGRSLRKLRREVREYMIRRGRGAARPSLAARWRQARLRKTRAQRRAATQAALLGEQSAETAVAEPSVAGYVVAVLAIAAIVVVVLLVLI